LREFGTGSGSIGSFAISAAVAEPVGLSVTREPLSAAPEASLPVTAPVGSNV
jgi:hypothetical protein